MSEIASVNPARPAEVVASVVAATASDVDTAVARATAAQREWARVTIPARAEIIAACGEALAARKAEVATLVSREVGKVLAEAAGDVQEAIDMAVYVAGQGRAPWGETVPCEMPDKLAFTTRGPVGVVGMITPWNFPIAIPSWKIFPALLAGNGVVIKPSEHAPKCCEMFVEICRDAGVPADLVQVVHGMGEVGAAITTHPGIRAVSFTGSVPTGRAVAAAAMEHGPKLVSPRARRQERHGRARRRRPRSRRRRRRVRRVRHFRPAVHIDLAPRRAPRDPRRAHRARRRSEPSSSSSATRRKPPPMSVR